MLPRQQFLWGVFMATGIGKLWQNWNNGSAICKSNALEWSSIMTVFFSEEISHNFFGLMLCSTLINPYGWVSAEKSICQHLTVPFVPHSFFCFRVLKSPKYFTKIVQPSRFNVCFRGHLYLSNSWIVWRLLWNLNLVIHFHIFSKAILDKSWDYSPLFMLQLLK